MDISTCAEELLAKKLFVESLSDEILDILRNGSNQEYVFTLGKLALDSRYTSIIFTTHEKFFVEICSNWLTAFHANSAIDPVMVVLALSRILPLAPHLAVYAKELLFRQQPGILRNLSSRSPMALAELPDSCLSSLLLAMFRLLRFDNEEFGLLISPAKLQLLLSHHQQSVRYLTIRILCLYLHASDSILEKMVENYCSEENILGPWEHMVIDYAFLTLWEEKRIKVLTRELEHSRSITRSNQIISKCQRNIMQDNLSNSTVCLGNVLLPMLCERRPEGSSLIMTKTFTENMSRFAQAINGQKPVLLTGPPGCGKTSLVTKLANELGQGRTMITLHLSNQTDAKLLIGMYVSASTPGSFQWQPGLLTKAVMEGLWVMIEDLDRAPTEILSTILPLLERRELLVPHWGETIRAASDFKMIASIRTIPTVEGEQALPGFRMLGMRHWLRVPLLMPSNDELAETVESKYPVLHAYTQKIIRVYSRLRTLMSSMQGKLISQRLIGPGNLYRWCSRLHDLFSMAGVRSGNEPISETMNDMILLEAIDCFAGHVPSGATKSCIAEVISQELHVPAGRVKYYLEVRKPDYVHGDAMLRIGRTCVSKKTAPQPKGSLNHRPSRTPFAITSQVLRNMESITTAIKMGEPCLLVGETGAGKTTLVQHLADSLGAKLHVINLSQQSEASDLLGGFKPVSIQALAVPMKEEFDFLFERTFSSKRNQKYMQTIGKAISKGHWLRALTLWKEALRMVREKVELKCHNVDGNSVEPRLKKRKVETPKNLKLRERWDRFSSSLETFQMHIGCDSKGFAFSFVEGHIVKAAKNGDWILLDEINLASQDTLESLADLITNGSDDVPTMLLPETGSAERIQVHKEFRIFGAMNPATDVGKKDLPSSLRSRFTEIYLDHPDRDYENLVSIVKVYLGSHNNLDLHIASDIAHLYLEIQKLTEENRLVDGANQKPHYSLRTLTRTLIYITDIISIYGLRRALYEGFSMSFLTLLNKESELLLVPLIHKYVLGNSKNAESLIRQTPRTAQDVRTFVQFRHYWIARGAAPVQQQPHYVITPFVERNLLNLVRATSTRRFPVLLQGPTSSGKTSMISYLAKISGNQCLRINNHEHTDLQEYLGSYVSGTNGRLQFQEGILVRALREGHWIILDELNLAPTDVLEALNRLLDDNKELLVPETQQVIKPHENFMLFATQNPPGMYGGRKMLSRAFRNRFLELHFDDIPEGELETILRERSQIAPSYCARIVTVYKNLSIYRQRDRLFDQKNSFATLRDLFRWALRDAENREQLATNGFLLLAERVRNLDERLVVKKIIEDVMKINIDIAKVYGADGSLITSTSSLPRNQEIVWTKSMRRLYVLVSQALQRNEPVLLVGETGSGKTTICQVIAAAMNKKLHIVNAHQNMETGDLIGTQRPVRNRGAISTSLVQNLTRILKKHMVYREILGEDISSLLSAYDAYIQEEPTALSTQERACVEQHRTQLEKLFEWSDGSLVHAMRDGQYFLLDEISLADDSVLERLNSVLEPDRTLLLAEQGSTDNLISASDGFQFLATMNPGGDYGKRELSPALRNRFTEIWVPQATDYEEMLQIAEAKLSLSFFEFSSRMVSFAAWYSTTYNDVAPNISIRELLTWIQFVNSYSGSDPYHALLHGAAMVYIDGLGANPSARVRVSEADVHHQREECLAKLGVIFQHDMGSIYKREIEFSLTDHKLCLGPFCLEIINPTSRSPGYHLETPTTKANAMKIIRALQLRKPILLEGSPGVGKSTIVMALADLVGVPLTRINLSDQTELMDLFGSDVPIDGAHAGNFGWRDAPFLRAMQNGEWVLLDEMNLASQTVLEGLNACFDHRGQVYISELGQTFTRHPRFTVFAAQNPHHQGGGRKGLPASFVNRFTIVYTEPFTAGDLLMICSHCYPQDTAQSVESLVRCVTDVGKILHTENEMNAHGGPWEINLRDLFRWLNLLHSDDLVTSAGNAVDYEDLVFLQRFRNPANVSAVMKVLEKHLPQAKKTPSFIYNMTSSYLQVGFALIQRHPLATPVIDRRLKQVSLDLRLLESALLCIKNAWPCLLVGPSGSGKTSIILQLASYVGTDIVNLPLNADMDTMDLIGGYEQLDVQRHRMTLLEKLRQTTRSLIAAHLASAPNTDLDILKLEEKLRAEMPDMKEIINLSRRLENLYPNSCYSYIAAECEKISHQYFEDNGARFEWVDGLLVKALKQGHWLVLDNANLCSSSILDRLNALLEPNGFLSINEHSTADGSAHIVKPHQNFRLFLTIDPRHGELSRAMRNRCIEIYMPTELLGSTQLLGTAYEPSISHFQVFDMINWTALDDTRLHELSSLCSDFLTVSDYMLCHRWQVELNNGLLEIPPIIQSLLMSDLNIRHEILKYGGNIISTIQAVYEGLAVKSGLPRDFKQKQYFNPLVNPVLNALNAHGGGPFDLAMLGESLELLVEVSALEAKLRVLSQKLDSKSLPQMTRLERSLTSRKPKIYDQTDTRHVGDFLKRMMQTLKTFIDGSLYKYPKGDEIILHCVGSIISYLRDIFDVTNSAEFDEGIFQAYLTIGRFITQRAAECNGLESLAWKLDSEMDEFNMSWQLSTGLSMEILWRLFMPPLAKNLRQVESRARAKQLANRFDAIKWVMGASIQELDLLRRSIINLHDTIDPSEVDLNDRFKDIELAINEVEKQSTWTELPEEPHFSSQFEGICQHLALKGYSEPLFTLELLAGRPASFSMDMEDTNCPWASLAHILRVTGIFNSRDNLKIVQNTLHVSLLAKLVKIRDIPLRRLSFLREEIKIITENTMILSSCASGDHLNALNYLLARIIGMVCQAHRDLLDPLSLSSCLAYIETCNWRSSEDNFAVKDYPVLRLQSGVPESHYFRDIVKNYMNPGLKSVHDSLKQGPEKLADGAAAWIYIFTCCLKIYVPDRPFDPALKPYVERDRYHRRQAELLVKLDALQSFQMLLTGQPKSLRSHIVQHKLEKLGDEPHAIAVPRPRVSEISKLCGEFKNLLDSVVSRCPDGSVLSSLFDGDVTRQQELELLRSNISRVITRISSGFAAYEDITKPLVAMLHGLDVGLAMALLASPTSSWSGSDIRQVSTSTPFLGMQISYYSQPGLHAAESTSAHDLNSRIKFLKNMAVYRSVNQEITPSVSQKMCEIFHSIYEDWRGRMEKDKHHKELLSSMYHYRGVESNDTCSDDNSFLDLFPDLLETGEKLGDGDKSQPDQRSLAQELAVCHKDIFQSDKSTSHFTLTILEDAAEKIGRLWLNNLDANACDVPTDETACAVLLGLSNHHTRLNDLSVAPKTYNFYADANLAEVSNLVNIVSKVQTRFTYLTEVWPEHATVKNVLQTSCELMAFSHVEPIAKVLTKTEQLHVFLHEWQAVASKEYTAITLYDQITNLLIGWRRLELSTWAQLLDMEDRKSNDDVDSWWFVAYEAIIAVPLSMISSGENIQPYSQQLFATLGEFLTTSTIGQFSRRLRLVECFKGHVKLVALEAHSFKIIHDTLLNFLSFYEPYEKNIQETLHERRRNLEKDVKEVVLLASWKDTNINALRESAKRSHNKLFKIIRKYRTILAQPAKDLIGGKILEKITMSEQCVENSTEQTLLVDSKAIEINKQCLPYWGLKPVRFTDPSSTAKKMKSMAQLAPDMLGCALSLQDIAADLVRNIDILQNETPRKAKKEDERAAKHLKTRKRKLFSETLRKIRHMGFQPNLSSSKLDQQASSAAVLGKCPSMPPVTGSIRFRDADFHRLLRLMPQARESFRNHSSDLTAREISRSIGYLESILMLTIKQRSKIITGLWELNRLDEIICMIQNLWAPEKYTLQRDKSWQSCAAKDQEKVIKWLPGIVAAGSILVKKYDDLTGHDSSAVIKALEGWQKQLEVSVKAYDCIPTLPFGVSSSVHETTHHQAKHLLSEFKAYLQESRIENANLSFIWKQIDLWTEVNKTALDPQTEDELPISLTEVDKVISEACDSIMVAMQRMKNIMSSYSSAEEGSNWLFVTDTLFVNCLSVFQPSRMMSVLGDALSRTSHVEANDESGLVAIGAIWATALPIIQQYRNSLKDCVGHYANFQQALCRLASMLADVFCRIASQGFCNPPEDSETPAGTTEKLEEGTGLGEGEGEKDISKDIKNDEDLSELAQQGDKDMASDIDDQEGAVNMDYDELEGEIEDVPEEDQTHRDANEGEESNIDDEMGDVDDLDPSAIDEKLWDGKPEETSKEKEDSKQTGKSPKPEQMAAESEIPDGSDKDHRSEENEMSESNFEENEQVVHGESEKLDPHLQEEQNLDLPEGLNFNDDDHLSADSPSDFSSVEGDSVADTEESKDEIAHDNIDDISSSEDAATTEEMLRPPNNEGDESMSVNGTEEAASPVDMETTETEGGSGHDRLRDHTMDANTDPTNEPTNGDQGYAADDDQRNEDQQNEGMNDRAIEGGKGDSSVNDKLTASGNGYLGQNNEGMKEDNDEEEQIENKSGNPAFKKLGDALERWHKRQREIRNGQTQEKELQDNKNEVDMSGQEFEHLNGELEAADAQALGAATWDQAQALNAQALESQMQDQPADLGSEENAVEGPAGEHFEIFPLKNEENQDLSRLGAIIVDDSTREHVLPKDSTGPSEKLEADIDDLGTDLTTTHLYSAQLLSQRTFSEASRLWAHYESLTHSLSLSLTEQLRLILAPTLATKMRGDFRTGKRLNIKRIIPYIASNYKRDKIWMRRSIPSKRAYQILLSVDDSKSMSESHGGHLALQTLALVAKSLSMLEAGEMCIVGFGTEVRVAHPFDRPFSSDAGPAALRNFNFQQPHTDVKKLLQASLALFRDARLKSARSGTTDLWQLQLIISDGVCEDHDAIRRLMRSAQQERIVIVFIILDAGKGESILDMSQAVFELDSSEQDGLRIPGNASADGIDARPTKLRIKRYLDGFPFPYYLVVGDVKELPGVLATALRQWFAEVVESG